MYLSYKIGFFVFCILLLPCVFSNIINEDNMKLFAVTPEGIGTDANLAISIKPGTGQVWSSIKSLVGTSTQNTEKTAVELLQKYAKNTTEYDYFFSINSTAKVVDGPSAGLPTLLLLIYMIEGKDLPDYVSGTGTISSSGQIGKVGGVIEKTKYAAQTGIKIFFIPASELEAVIKEDNEVKKVNLASYAYEKYGIKVIGIENIDDVLKYNLNDINTVKIPNQKKEEKPIYDPPATTFRDNLKDFYNYISKYNEEVNTNILLVETVLKDTDLEDSDLLTELYSLLQDAKEAYNDGKSAYSKNYLYSSANQFFKANVSVNLIKDLIENSEILTANTKINELVKNLQKDYNLPFNNISCNNYEWQISAQERYLWATKRINNILSTPGNDKTTNILKLRDYEEAKEWLKIAKLFSGYAIQDYCYLNQKPYKESADQVLDEIKKADAIIAKYDLTDQDKWIQGAKDAKDMNWYFATVFEGATALASINSYLELKDLNLPQIKQMVEEQLKELEPYTKKDYVWTNLYLQHANYYYNEGLFYEEKSQEQNALESYKSAYQLGLFAKNLSQVTEDIEKNKQSISYIDTKSKEKNIKNIGDWNFYQGLAFVFVLVILILIFVLIIFYNKVKANKGDQYLMYINFRISKIKQFLIQAEKDYKNKKLSDQNYVELTENLLKELQFLNEEGVKISKKTEEIKEFENQIDIRHKKVKELKENYSKNLISQDEYFTKLREYDIEVSDIQKKIDEDVKEVTKTALEQKSTVSKKKGNEKSKQKKRGLK